MKKGGESETEATVRVMVVDDDPFIREVAATALMGARGVTVATFDSGAAALAAADAFAPGLVLLDLMMPEMDGRAVAAALAARSGPRPRLIFLTGRDDAATRTEAVAMGAAGLIVKPFDPATFAGVVLGLAEKAEVQAARLEALARNFAASLPSVGGSVERSWRKLAAWNAPAAEALLADVHRVAGVAPMFGFKDVGAAADRVEELTRAALAKGGWDGAERGAVEAAVGILLRSCATSPDAISSDRETVSENGAG